MDQIIHSDSRNLVAQLESFGLSAIGLVEQPLTRLGSRDVRIRVRAASLNHRDLMVARGELSSEVNLPFVLLSDCAGEVIEIGRDVSRFRIGDRVAAAALPEWIRGPFREAYGASMLGGPANGVLGTFFSAHENSLVPIPENFSFAEAATLPRAALTAWNALFELGNLKPGQTVLVLGSGGVSSFALQFALAAGAQVIATTGTDEKVASLRQLGAACVINHRRQPEWSREVLAFTGGLGVDHVIETGGAGTLDQSIKSTTLGGTISLIGMLTGATGRFDTLPILRRTLRIQGVIIGSVEMFERMNGTIETLDVRPTIDRVFEMKDVCAALRYFASGRHVGKIVIKV